MTSYTIVKGAKVTLQHETIAAGLRTFTYNVEEPLSFLEDELVGVKGGTYHFRYKHRHYYAEREDILVLP